jgi:FkbM family methyltransferase
MRFLLVLLSVLFFNLPAFAQTSQEVNYDLILSKDEAHREKIIKYVGEFNGEDYYVQFVTDLGGFLLERSCKQDGIKDILRRNVPWEGYIAPYIQTYAKPGTLALDVGAHIGTHTLNISRAVGENGQVIAFEPQPKTFRELFLNCQLNNAQNVCCFWGALGDKEDELVLPNFHPIFEVTYLYDFTYGASENTAPMVTLDSLNLDNISFMKIDVDGCDDIFLDGAKETILRNKPVLLMEIMGGSDIDNTTPDIKELIINTKQKITNLGYELTRISSWDYLAIPQ